MFYLLFYAALIGFFAAMLTVFYQTLDSKQPKWKLDSSLIGSNPGKLKKKINNRFILFPFQYVTGLGFRPMPPESNVESTLVWYKSADNNNIAYWVDELNRFLKSKLK